MVKRCGQFQSLIPALGLFLQLYFMRLVWQLLLDVIFWWPSLWAADSRWGEWSSESKQNRALTHRDSNCLKQAHRKRFRTDHLTDRLSEVRAREEGGSDTHKKNYMATCMSHQSGSSSISSNTWTEPPSRSAVRCDPRVSLLVTGVGWDSLPLGSGDLTQRAKRVEAGGGEVVKRGGEDVGSGGEAMWWEGRGWGARGKGEWVKKKQNKKTRKQKQKNYRRHLPSRSRLVKTNYVNRVEGSENLTRSTDQHTNKSHAGVKENSLDHLS